MNRITESQINSIVKKVLTEDSKNPGDVNTYPPCVANETSNKNRGALKKTKTGQYSIEVYIAGLTGFQFYNNGKVLYPDKKTIGNYVCDGYKIIIDGHDTINQKWENGKWSNDATYPVTNYEKRELQKASNISKNLDAHTLLTISQIGTAFIPLVGPFISAGIGLADASLYYKEGDTKTAGLVGVFSLLPGMGSLVSKLGIGKLGSKAMAEIGKKIGIGTKLTAGETQMVNNIAKYKALIQSEINKLGQNAGINVAKQNVKKQLTRQAVKTKVVNVVKPIVGYGAVGYGHNKSYDYVQRKTPKTKSEKDNLNWDFVKSSFGSLGSLQDNTLLNQAWNSGWRPGNVVPKEFQTLEYQKQNVYNQEAENIKKLMAMTSSSK
jgi:hypothetical protein